MINFSRKSWHYKLYYSLYGYHVPNNLCPYFWQVIVALLISPVYLPFYWIGRAFEKMFDSDIPRFFVGIIITCALWFLTGMVGMWWVLHKKNNWHDILCLGGGIGFGLVFIFGISALFAWNAERLRGKKLLEGEDYEPKSSLFKEFVKAKYNRYCPKITWK